jgi:hypothetical protein
LGNKLKKILACSSGLILLSLIYFCIHPGIGSATEISEFEKYKEKQFGPEYYNAIEGEVYGQTAPGIQAVYVNGKPIKISDDFTFRTKVSLKKGEKYLTIETHYEGIRFIKKYLVIRYPKAEKKFAIHVPQKEFHKIIKTAETIAKAEKKPPAEKAVKKAKPKPKPKARPKPKPKAKPVSEAKLVSEAKTLAEAGPETNPAAEAKPGITPAPTASFGFKPQEFKSQAEVQVLSQAIKADNYAVTTTAPPNSIRQLNEIVRKPDFYETWKEKNKTVFLSGDTDRLIRETDTYRSKPFSKLTKTQQQKIIRLNRSLIEETYLLAAPKSRPAGVKPPAKEDWLGYEFVAGLEPGKLLIVNKTDGKYFGSIIVLSNNVWIPLQEISYKEFKALLEKGTIPPSFVPQNKL